MNEPIPFTLGKYTTTDKALIILGKPGSGKSKLADRLASAFPSDEVVMLNARHGNSMGDPFFFSCCTRTTKLVVIHDISNLLQIQQLYSAVSDGIHVEKRGASAFNIHPRLILTCDGDITRRDIKRLGVLAARRFDIVKCFKTKQIP